MANKMKIQNMHHSWRPNVQRQPTDFLVQWPLTKIPDQNDARLNTFTSFEAKEAHSKHHRNAHSQNKIVGKIYI